MKKIKPLLKKIVRYAPIALTKNEYYDRLTKKIINKVCTPDSVCVDAGSHNGKILEMMIKAAPKAKHYAFEPVPDFFTLLENKFSNNAKVYCVALSDKSETTSFNVVLTNMAFSGLKKRVFEKGQKDVLIFSETERLDNIIPSKEKITLLKMDVEGAELLVLHGAIKTIEHSKPIILFEFGKEGSALYEYDDTMMFSFINETLQYQIFTLKEWLRNQSSLSAEQFHQYYENGEEYFFVAAPRALKEN